MGAVDKEVSGRTVRTKPRSSTEFKLEIQLARKRCTPLIDGLNKYAEQLLNRPSIEVIEANRRKRTFVAQPVSRICVRFS
jgi:hypothetical protein